MQCNFLIIKLLCPNVIKIFFSSVFTTEGFKVDRLDGDNEGMTREAKKRETLLGRKNFKSYMDIFPYL